MLKLLEFNFIILKYDLLFRVGMSVILNKSFRVLQIFVKNFSRLNNNF